MAYQHTPNASKRNAFCWQTYESQIDWDVTGRQTAGAKQTGVIEAKRAEGVDLLYLGGMGSAVRQDARYRKDRALPQLRRARR